MKKIILSLILITSFLQIGCMGDECPAIREQGTDSKSGVHVQYNIYPSPGGSDYGQCSGGASDEVIVTSPSGESYRTTNDMFSQSDSSKIAKLFPDLKAVQDSTDPIVLDVIPEGLDHPDFTLEFKDVSTDQILGTKTIQMNSN